MGKNLLKQYNFRTNEEIVKKMNFIAEANSRTRNREIEYLLKEHIKNYEQANNVVLKINEEGNVYQEKQFEKVEYVENLSLKEREQKNKNKSS